MGQLPTSWPLAVAPRLWERWQLLSHYSVRCKYALACFGSGGHRVVCFPFVVCQFNLLLIIKSGTYLALKPEVIENAPWHTRPIQRLALGQAEDGVESFPGPQWLLALQ